MRQHRGSPLTIFSETYIKTLLASTYISDKGRHGFLRRTANPLFSQTFLRELEPTIKAYYQCFIDGIAAEARQNNGVVNITKWIDHLAFDVNEVSRPGSWLYRSVVLYLWARILKPLKVRRATRWYTGSPGTGRPSQRSLSLINKLTIGVRNPLDCTTSVDRRIFQEREGNERPIRNGISSHDCPLLTPSGPQKRSRRPYLIKSLVRKAF
jgi:hypothetical protein